MQQMLVHIGIYVFHRDVLERLTGISRSLLAESEDLEQLDWVFQGLSMLTEVVNWTVPSVDVLPMCRLLRIG